MSPLLRPFTRPWLYGHIGLALLGFYFGEKLGLSVWWAGILAAFFFPLRALLWKFPRWWTGRDLTDPPSDWIIGAVVPAVVVLIIIWGIAP
jgi:hypothetical protein